ncbi:MAG: DUF423 domain-containing protein [Cyclobacteriaceae bacterium]|nr:DUF423 domain-containing protein [Cyclobacteriaceae bacterium]
MLSQRQTLIFGSLLGGLAVALGAFGSHTFKSLLLENNRVDTYELATQYHFFHALTMLVIGVIMTQMKRKSINVSATFIFIGTILFSGSLYVMALLNTTKVAFVTPIGGLFLLTGWAVLVYSLVEKSAAS